VPTAYCPRVKECQVGSTDGTLKSTGLVRPTAESMNVFQIVAGNVGPETAIPCTLSIGTSPRG
jgi:hypothetical protein